MTRGALAAAALALLAGCKQGPQAAPAQPDLAAAAPRLPPTVDGRGIAEILAAHKGAPVLVNVFASWCGPCRDELPAIDKLAREHQKLYVVGIDVDADGDGKPDQLSAFLRTVPASIHVVRAPSGVKPLLPSLKLPDDWYAAVPAHWDEQVPLSFMFAAGGSFENGSVGQLTPEAIEAFGGIAAGGPARP